MGGMMNAYAMMDIWSEIEKKFYLYTQRNPLHKCIIFVPLK
jgi:hypothetical protein